jgi:modulator of FtsH protease HflK
MTNPLSNLKDSIMKVEDFLQSRPVFKPERQHVVMVGMAVGVLMLLVVGMTTFYTVESESLGVVTRFGKYTGTLAEPGLHLKLPLGIDRVQIVAVERQQKEEFGFRTESAGVRTLYQRDSFGSESLMVTGDLNAAVVEWSVQYRVSDPVAYLFNVRDPVETMRYSSEAVMREVVGDHTVDEVLTILRQQIASDAQVQLQQVMDAYQMGLRIDRVVLQDVTPPEPVRDSFNEVNQAQQERERLINDARAEYNRIIPSASGEARQRIQAAEGYATERVNEAEGDAARFNAIFTEYLKAPDVTRGRMYLETMGDVLPKLGNKYIID